MMAIVNHSYYRITLIHANRRKLIDLYSLSPIGLLLGVSLAWSYYQESWNSYYQESWNSWNKSQWN